ncbi:MAG TPA: DUF1538 family protein, partial [Cryomorphaceae bacterium]|nr:DUF1538 family protein [Cryomorphaceae bacterium]
MLKLINKVANKFKAAFIDLLPIVLVVSFFQIFVLKQPFPNFAEVLVGFGFVVLGLVLFVEGLKVGLFPIGENLSSDLVKKGSVFWLLLFSFLLGFSTTVAEPALIAVTLEAAEIAVERNLIGAEIQSSYALGLRL